LLIIFKVPIKLFRRSNKIIFQSVSSKILDLSAKSFFPCSRVYISLFLLVLSRLTLDLSQPSRLLMTLSADGHHPAQEFEMALILFHALFIYTATWRAIAPIAVRHGFMKSAAKRRP